MCAIAGIVGIRTETSVLNAMQQTMKRRGPDAQGVYEDNEVQLLHARLAIIDPVGGVQPMELFHNGEKYILVYNGELYNTDELRQKLESKGHVFLGHSDTEVVLHAYAQWGESCLELFNGIFAFSVWECSKRRLFLARDRMGVKPLFFTQLPEGLLFASEMKTIFCHPKIHPQLDEQGAAQILLLGPGRIPGSGVFHGIQELEPGCCATYDMGKLRVRRYWKLRDRKHTDNFEDTAEYVRFLVTDSIKRQMVSDVPIGTFLSGGLDSSIISAVCAQKLRQEGKRLNTFSVDYQNNGAYFTANKFQPESDGEYIQFMSATLDTDHHDTILTSEQLSGFLEAATQARDLPGMADVDFSLLAFCGEIRKDVKVALSGECADEIFGGYPWFRDPDVRSKAGFPWAQNTHHRGALMSDRLRGLVEPESFVMDAYLDTCKEADIHSENTPEERRVKEMVNLNFRRFMQTLLDRKDRMSMYNALEVRVPFCDYRIAEYLYGVPWEYKDYRNREKGLLRYAMKGILPDRVRCRKKSPYPKTYDPKYEEIMESRLKSIMAGDTAMKYMVSQSGLEELLNAQSPWPWYGQLMRRPQILAYFVQLDFWLNFYNVEMLF